LLFPRRRESHKQHVNIGIPAFAGMTVKNMATKQQIFDDFTAAFKARDELRKRTLESIKSEILVKEKSPDFVGKEMSGEAIIAILKSMAKKRRESIEAYGQGNRSELAAKEKEELAIIESYLPEQISEEQVRKVIKKIVETQDFASKDFGKAMGAVMAELKGKADGGMVGKILKEMLV